MAKQKSIIKLEGTIGDISFYKSRNGYLAREKTSLDAERIATDPKFRRTRENGAEFGRAGAAGKVLRRAFKELIHVAHDKRLANRLTREMIKVIQADAVSVRGMRNVLDGELELLTGFNFNIHSTLDTVAAMDYEADIDRVSGVFLVTIPVFDPKLSIKGPAGTTHYRLVMGASSIDFETGISVNGQTATDYLGIEEATTEPLTLEVSLTPDSTHPLLMTMGIFFYQELNGVYYPLNSDAYNALSLVKVNGV